MSLPWFSLLVFCLLNSAESCLRPRQFDECGCIGPRDVTFNSIDLLAPPGSRANYSDGIIYGVDYYYGDIVDGKALCNKYLTGCPDPEDTYIVLMSYETPGSIRFQKKDWRGYFGYEVFCNQTDHMWNFNGYIHTFDEQRMGCYKENNHATTSK